MSTPRSSGPLIEPVTLAFLEPISRLHATNPFEPAWEALLKDALRGNYVPEDGGACSRVATLGRNVERITEPLAMQLAGIGSRLARGVAATPMELAVYQGAAIYGLWDAYGTRLQRIVDDDGVDAPFYDHYLEKYRFLFDHPGLKVPDPAHLFALLYQARRAWYFPATKILGGSASATTVCASLWRVSMGSEICAYAESVYRHMDEIPVLITGETGTGKELAAECIGGSRYIPFDAGTRRFVRKYREDFHARNLCEVPAELQESALFGHRRGSFTGATADAQGCFALAREHGALFFDEAGEIPLHVQAKLLRPLQNREYVPLGETRPRPIPGQLVFATHRDLDALCREGKFRPDLHERMNGFHIHMPPLRQMLAEAPGELRRYVQAFVAAKIESPARVEAWTEGVMTAIRASRADYPWPRNLRELKNYTERCLLEGVTSCGERARDPAGQSRQSRRPRQSRHPRQPSR